MFSFLRDVSLLIGIWVAIYGIDSWRREHRGKRDIELAEDALTLFYEARDAIKYMRNPLLHVSEYADIEKNSDETDGEFAARRKASVTFRRYDNRNDLFNKIYAMRYRFMAQIGLERAKPYEELKVIINDILRTARILAYSWPQYYSSNQLPSDKLKQKIERYEAVLWEGSPEEDPITPKIDETIDKIENTCRKIITAKGTLYSYLNQPLEKCKHWFNIKN